MAGGRRRWTLIRAFAYALLMSFAVVFGVLWLLGSRAH
jgi:hypothetical protein